MSIHEASYTSITSTHCLSSAMLSAIDDYCLDLLVHWFPKWRSGKESACDAGDQGSILGWEVPLEKGMTIHSSILAWRIPQTKKPGGLQSIELRRVGRN